MTTDTAAPAPLASLGTLILRLVVGGVFAMHGAQKVFDFTVPGTVSSFDAMGVPLAPAVAPAIALLELVGGALLILGVLSRIVAALLAIDMLGAIALVHAPAGFWVDAGGWEFVAVLAAASAALALTGPGRFAVGEFLSRKLRRFLA